MTVCTMSFTIFFLPHAVNLLLLIVQSCLPLYLFSLLFFDYPRKHHHEHGRCAEQRKALGRSLYW